MTSTKPHHQFKSKIILIYMLVSYAGAQSTVGLQRLSPSPSGIYMWISIFTELLRWASVKLIIWKERPVVVVPEWSRAIFKKLAINNVNFINPSYFRLSFVFKLSNDVACTKGSVQACETVRFLLFLSCNIFSTKLRERPLILNQMWITSSAEYRGTECFFPRSRIQFISLQCCILTSF